jgi:hypothetical protein
MKTEEQRPWRATAKAVEEDTLCLNPITSSPTNVGHKEGSDRPPAPSELAALIAILNRLADALERQERQAVRPRFDPMTLRIEQVADALGVSRRAIERERSAGRFPRPDVVIGKMPIWKVETIRSFLQKGGHV